MITHEPLDINGCYRELQHKSHNAGALVTFTGLVRDYNLAGGIQGIHLEHYPGMTEKALQQLIEQAHARFDLIHASIVHRVGDIANHAPIVWVGTASSHRQQAFDSACFIMDMLKKSVPLWKKEYQHGQATWVASKATDEDAAMKWLADKE